MTKHRKNKNKTQKGGFSLNPINWFNNSTGTTDATYVSPSTTQSWGDYFSNWGSQAKKTTDDLNASIGEKFNSLTNTANALNPLSSNTSNVYQGGKRCRTRRSKRGLRIKHSRKRKHSQK